MRLEKFKHANHTPFFEGGADMSVKLTGWKQIRSIFLSLLLFLLMLWGLWTMGPLFVSNVGKLIGTITASSKLDTWFETIAKNYQFFVFLFSMFVICIGFTRWLWQTVMVSGSDIPAQTTEASDRLACQLGPFFV
jgi:hypothetical protein